MCCSSDEQGCGQDSAKRSTHTAQLEVESLIIRSNSLRQMIKMVERKRQLWESRDESQLKEEAARAGCLATRLTPLAYNQHVSRHYLRQQIGITNEEATTGPSL